MENINLMIFACLAIPSSMMLYVFKGHSRRICAFLLVGMFMCVFAGEINGLFLNLFNFDQRLITVNIAPLVEEISKALPIIFIAFLSKPNKQTLIEYSISLGVGFATVENISLLIQSESLTLVYAVLRAIGAGIMHGICTLIVGVAMRYIIEEKMVFFTGTLSALSVAVIYHSIYNMLINSKYIVVGVILPLVTFTLIMVYNGFRNKREALTKD